MNNSKPNRKLKCGSITAAIWSKSIVQDDTMVEVHSIKIDKIYREGDVWKNTSYFVTEDLPKVVLVAEEAYKSLRLRQETRKEDEPGAEQPGTSNENVDALHQEDLDGTT